MSIAYHTAFPTAVAVAGLLLWALSSSQKVSEAGKILFFCGTLVAVSNLSGAELRLGR